MVTFVGVRPRWLPSTNVETALLPMVAARDTTHELLNEPSLHGHDDRRSPAVDV
jgi:hypothetical protein